MKTFESPLVSHVRMRAMYRALVEVRALGGRLGGARLPEGLEAAWVAGAIDLREGDVILDRGGEGLAAYVRGVGVRKTAGVARSGEVRELLAAEPQGFAGTATERMVCAMGAAMALKKAGQGGACVAFAQERELTAAEWKRVLTLARDGALPLVLVCAGAKTGGKTGRAVKGVPAIPVDGGDVLAIYRVMQECLVRARAEGGLAVVECVRSGLDPVEMFGGQLVKKGIATAGWVAGCAKHFGVVAARV